VIRLYKQWKVSRLFRIQVFGRSQQTDCSPYPTTIKVGRRYTIKHLTNLRTKCLCNIQWFSTLRIIEPILCCETGQVTATQEPARIIKIHFSNPTGVRLDNETIIRNFSRNPKVAQVLLIEPDLVWVGYDVVVCPCTISFCEFADEFDTFPRCLASL